MNQISRGINLVLGCATDYTLRQVLPFAMTLRHSGYSDEAIIFVYRDQVTALTPLSTQFGITLLQIPRLPRFLPSRVGRRLQNRGRMRFVHRLLARTLTQVCRAPRILSLTTLTLRYFYHIECARHFLYYLFLAKRQGVYGRIFLSDVRDVIFQEDPFRYASRQGLYFFLDPTVRLGDEPVNQRWMTITYGEDYNLDHLGRRIACAGTTLGDYASMMDYLRAMCLELIRLLPRVSGLGVDQAIHNYLLWEQRLPQVVLCENGENAVMTLKNAVVQPESLDASGRLLNRDGIPAPVLHQYDVHPILNRFIGSRLY